MTTPIFLPTIFLVKAHIANTTRLEAGVNCASITRAPGGEGFIVVGIQGVPEGVKVTIPWSNIGTVLEREPKPEPPPTPDPPSPPTSKKVPEPPKKPNRKSRK